MRKTIFLRDAENRLFIMLSFPAGASGSDSHTRFFDFSVRSWPGFGLSLRVFRFLCPKLAQVRTLSPAFSISLSEVGPGSDFHTGFFDFSVRSWPRFGLPHRVFRLLCPKLAQVWTPTTGFSISLSEVGPGLDSHNRFFDFSVRS